MLIVDRCFLQQKPDSKGARNRAAPLPSFFASHALIVLGDPGMGKTTVFEQAAQKEAGAAYYRVGQFLTYPLDELQGKVLYLDGLDEQRAKGVGENIIDRIAGRLLELGKPKVRISCRTIDWHGDSDITGLIPVSVDEDVFVLTIKPLSDADIHVIAAEKLEDPNSFIEGAYEHGVHEYLKNPQDLDLYLEVFRMERGWPKTRTELFEKGTWLLCQERNKEHARKVDSFFSDTALMEAAEDLAAIYLLTNLSGFENNAVSYDSAFPAISSLQLTNVDAMQEVAGRRLFVQPEPERVAPKHRMIAEFLAAKGMARRIRMHSLPLGRVMALLTGFDGGTLSDLRGVYAWLISFLSEYAEQLLSADPYGAIVYGDPALWSIKTKEKSLALLRELSVKDPYFRVGVKEDHSLFIRGLSCLELQGAFTEILETETNSHLVSVVLSALENGAPVESMGDTLLRFIHESQQRYFARRAVRAFVNACPNRLPELKGLLDEVRRQEVIDEDLSLRTELLRQLYPQVIRPSEIPIYFVFAEDVSLLDYDFWVGHELVELTPEELLPDLAVVLLAEKSKDDLSLHAWRNLCVGLLKRLIKTKGETASPEEIYSWFGLGIDEHGCRQLEKEDADFIRDFIATRPHLFRELFGFWILTINLPAQNGWLYEFSIFKQRIGDINLPENFLQFLFASALSETKDLRRANFLFEGAVRMSFATELNDPQLSSTEIVEFVVRNPQFADTWESLRVCRLSDGELVRTQKRILLLQERELRRQERIHALMPKVSGLRIGAYVEVLARAGWMWMSSHNPMRKMKEEYNDEIAQALEEGFESILKRDTPLSPTEIVKLSSSSEIPMIVFPVLVGADIVATRSREEFLGLPGCNLKEALICRLSFGGMSHSQPWGDWLYEDLPDLSSEAIEEYWRGKLAVGVTERLDGLYSYSNNSHLAQLVVRIAPKLFADFPSLTQEVLRDLLRVVVRFGNVVEVRALAIERLSSGTMDSVQETFWLAVAFLAEPNVYGTRLDAKMSGGDAEKWAAYDLLIPGVWKILEEKGDKAGIAILSKVIALLGKLIRDESTKVKGGCVGEHEPYEAARRIEGMIRKLGSYPNPEATEALAALKETPALVHWHDWLSHNHAVQVSIRRQAEYQYADVQQVCRMLNNEGPANVADMKALVVAILDDLAVEIRNGSTDGWTVFWNTDSWKRKGENECRDRLLEQLRARLSPKDIRVEREGDFAEHKRADIVAYHKVGKVPIEIKRDSDRRLWTALGAQVPQYTRDPEADGYGIYLVLWFGAGDMKKPSGDVPPPQSPSELLRLLQKLCVNAFHNRIVVRVLDVSRPKK